MWFGVRFVFIYSIRFQGIAIGKIGCDRRIFCSVDCKCIVRRIVDGQYWNLLKLITPSQNLVWQLNGFGSSCCCCCSSSGFGFFIRVRNSPLRVIYWVFFFVGWLVVVRLPSCFLVFQFDVRCFWFVCRVFGFGFLFVWFFSLVLLQKDKFECKIVIIKQK